MNTFNIDNMDQNDHCIIETYFDLIATKQLDKLKEHHVKHKLTKEQLINKNNCVCGCVTQYRIDEYIIHYFDSDIIKWLVENNLLDVSVVYQYCRFGGSSVRQGKDFDCHEFKTLYLLFDKNELINFFDEYNESILQTFMSNQRYNQSPIEMEDIALMMLNDGIPFSAEKIPKEIDDSSEECHAILTSPDTSPKRQTNSLPIVTINGFATSGTWISMIHYALSTAKPKIVKLFLDAGFNPLDYKNFYGNDGLTMLFLSIQQWKNNRNQYKTYHNGTIERAIEIIKLFNEKQIQLPDLSVFIHDLKNDYPEFNEIYQSS